MNTFRIFLLGALALAFTFLGSKAEARWYSPETAGFISRAPYPPAVEHPYSFAVQNPALYADVYGMFPWPGFLGGGASNGSAEPVAILVGGEVKWLCPRDSTVGLNLTGGADVDGIWYGDGFYAVGGFDEARVSIGGLADENGDPLSPSTPGQRGGNPNANPSADSCKAKKECESRNTQRQHMQQKTPIPYIVQRENPDMLFISN